MNRGRHKKDKEKIIPFSNFCTPEGYMIKQDYYVEGFKDNIRIFNEHLPFEYMPFRMSLDWLINRINYHGWNKIVINNQTIDINH